MAAAVRPAVQPFLNLGTPGPPVAITEEVAVPAPIAADRNSANGAKVAGQFHNGRELKAQASSSQPDNPVTVVIAVPLSAEPLSPFALVVSGHEKSSI